MNSKGETAVLYLEQPPILEYGRRAKVDSLHMMELKMENYKRMECKDGDE
jgi:hypothetical protein